MKWTVEAHPDELLGLRRALGQWLESVEMSEDRCLDLVLAAHEAAANVVAHAYGRGEGDLTMQAETTEDAVVVWVGDTGHWRPADVTDGGRGYPMMRALVDSVEVSRTSNGTLVRLSQSRTEPA